MRVALFTDTFMPQINGVTNTMAKMLDYFDRQGIAYRVFAPKYEDVVVPETVRQYYSLKFFLYPECRLALPNIFNINQIFEDFKPDIVHNMTEFGMGLAGLKQAQKCGLPSLSTYTTHFSQYLRYYNLEWLEGFVDDYMKWFHDQHDRTLCATKGTREKLNQLGIHRTEIFSRGIDTELFNPMQRNQSFRETHKLTDKVVFAYVGRISAEKGLDVLIEAYNAVYRRYGKQIALVMTGEGPYLDFCKAHLPEDTVFTGFKKGDALAECYASSDIFICPSGTETFGNVIQEAMASGLAVIGADAGGVGENIRHEETGLHFKSGEVSSLTEKMEALLQHGAFRKQLGANARAYALTRSWDHIFEELVGHYLVQKSTKAA